MFRRAGFTLIELLVVLAIIAALTGLLLPAVQKVRESASRTRCANNLKQIGLAIHNFTDATRALPPSRQDPGGTWLVHIFPFVEQMALASEWQANIGFYQQSQAARETGVPLYFCPSRRSASDGILATDTNINGSATAAGAVADYAACSGDPSGTADYWWTPSPAYPTPPANGAFIMLNNWDTSSPSRGQTKRRNMAAFKDGTSHTLLAGEKHVPVHRYAVGPWDSAAYNGDHIASVARAGVGGPLVTDPYDLADTVFGGPHPGVCLFVFADGSVHPLRTNIHPVTLGRLAMIADGQPIADGEF